MEEMATTAMPMFAGLGVGWLAKRGLLQPNGWAKPVVAQALLAVCLVGVGLYELVGEA